MNKHVLIGVVRKSFAELAIGVAACGAGYMFFVEPLEAKLAHTNSDIDSLRLAINKLHSAPAATGNSAKVAEQTKRLMASIDERSAPARHHTQMLQAIMNLADRTGVKVDQFNPSTPRGPRQPKPGSAPAPAAANNKVPAPGAGVNGPAPDGTAGAKVETKIEFRAAYSISLRGSYSNVIDFVRAVQQDIGFTFIKSMVISPSNSDGPNTVSVALETEHVGLETAGFLSTAAPSGGEVKP